MELNEEVVNTLNMARKCLVDTYFLISMEQPCSDVQKQAEWAVELRIHNAIKEFIEDAKNNIGTLL